MKNKKVNEFELKPEEKRFWRQCEKQHNQILINGLPITVESGGDLFNGISQHLKHAFTSLMGKGRKKSSMSQSRYRKT